MHPRRALPAPRAFTLVEAVISIAIVAIMLVAAVNVAGSSASARKMESNRSQGAALAQSLIAEITSKSWADPDADETDETRSTWDDIDDYHGFSETGVTGTDTDAGAGAMDGYAGWTRSASITTGFNGFPGLKKITVTVTSPTGQTISLSALRSRRSSLERQLQLGRTYTGMVNVTIQTGSDSSTSTTSSINPVNQIP